MRLEDLNWMDVEHYLEQDDRLILILGSCEQHAYLSLLTDIKIPQALADSASNQTGVLVAPPLNFGISPYFLAYPGTLSFGVKTMLSAVEDIVRSAYGQGFRRILIINGHGGNSPALNYAAQMINRDTKIFVCVDTGETSDVDIYAAITTPNDVHAGEIETSTALAVRPELVDMQNAIKSVPKFSNTYLNPSLG